MASGFFAVLDDIATLLDDTAVMSKVAAKKTAGLLGDDLAVNAEQATGFSATRELPVIWAITRGSFLNKLLILPCAFLLSAYLPWLIVPILLSAGAYLCYEGTEKVFEWLRGHAKPAVVAEHTADRDEILKRERTKIKAAIRTDFILSLEIVVVALDTVFEQPLLIQVTVVSLIAVLATIGVYGLVALLVRLDDTGYYLLQRATVLSGRSRQFLQLLGRLLMRSLPPIIRILGYIGTLAMLMVGGGMYVHNIRPVQALLHAWPQLVANLIAGLAVGTLLLLAMLAA